MNPVLVAPDVEFLYKPLVVEEPFSPEPAERRALAPIADELGAEFVQQAVAEIIPEEHELRLANGETLAYEAAIVCVGGRARPAFRRAISFEVTPEPLEIDRILTESAQRPPQTLAFVVPHGVAWSLPLYELALLSRRRAEELGLADLALMIVTPESSPLIVFGHAASDAVCPAPERPRHRRSSRHACPRGSDGGADPHSRRRAPRGLRGHRPATNRGPRGRGPAR